MSHNTPEDLPDLEVEKTNKDQFFHKLIVATASGLGGMTVAYLGSKTGEEVVTDPITILTEGFAVFRAAGARRIALQATYSYLQEFSTR